MDEASENQDRCLRCDFALSLALAPRVRVAIEIGPGNRHPLEAADILYCRNCSWWRPMNAGDVSNLQMVATA